jgi:excisionase family DNA binding protein
MCGCLPRTSGIISIRRRHDRIALERESPLGKLLDYSYGMATNDPAPLLSVRVGEASRMIGIGRTKIYELIKAGDLEKVKIGRATLVTIRSLRRLIEH